MKLNTKEGVFQITPSIHSRPAGGCGYGGNLFVFHILQGEHSGEIWASRDCWFLGPPEEVGGDSDYSEVCPVWLHIGDCDKEVPWMDYGPPLTESQAYLAWELLPGQTIQL